MKFMKSFFGGSVCWFCLTVVQVFAFIGLVAAAVEPVISSEELDSTIANISAASNAKDLESVRSLLWDDAQLVLISKGEMMQFNVPEYMNILKDSWAQTKNYTYEYEKDNCEENARRMRCLGTVRETMVLVNGQFMTSSVKGEDIFEKRDGVVKIIYSKANTDEATIGSRQSPNVPLEILPKKGKSTDGGGS